MSSRKWIVLIAREQADPLRALLASLPGQPEISLLAEPASLLDLPKDRRADLLVLDADLAQEGEIPWLRRAIELRRPFTPLLLSFSGRGASVARAMQDLSAAICWKPYLLGEVYAAATDALGAGPRRTQNLGAKSPPPELVRGLADELNNPLATISGYLQLLSLDLGKDRSGESAEKLAAIRDGLARIAQTVEQLALASGSRHPKKVPLDALGILRDAAKLWKSRMKGLSVHLPDTPQKFSVLADTRLLAAAIEAMGSFLHSVAQGKSELRVSLQSGDEGKRTIVWSLAQHALPEGAIAALFDPYALNALGVPAGLSLAAIRGILRVHGGEALAGLGENGSLEIRWIFPVGESP